MLIFHLWLFSATASAAPVAVLETKAETPVCGPLFAGLFNGTSTVGIAKLQQDLLHGIAQMPRADREELRDFLREAIDPKSKEFRLTSRQLSRWQDHNRAYFTEPATVNAKGRLTTASPQDNILLEEVMRRIPPYRDMDEFQRVGAIRKLAKECQ